MRKRPLGKTGLVVSELTIGTWGLGGEAYGAVSTDDAERVLRRAIDVGISVVDTADAYGAGRMERVVGTLLRDHPDLVVVTKGGVDRTTEPARKDFSPSYLRASIERSLKRLGAARLPVFLLHHPVADTLRVGDAVETLEALKAEGKIGHWGVCAGDEDVARAAIDKGAEVVELAYNLFHAMDLQRLAGDLMISGTGVLARSVLSYGLLAGLWPKGKTFPEGDHRAERWTSIELERRLDQLEAVRFLVKGDVHTLRGAAVRYVLSNPLVSSAVLGPRTVEQLEQLVRETGGGPRYLPDDDLRKLPRTLERAGLSW